MMMLVEQNVYFCIIVIVMINYIYTTKICSPSKLLLVRGVRINSLELFIPGKAHLPQASQLVRLDSVWVPSCLFPIKPKIISK